MQYNIANEYSALSILFFPLKICIDVFRKYQFNKNRKQSRVIDGRTNCYLIVLMVKICIVMNTNKENNIVFTIHTFKKIVNSVVILPRYATNKISINGQFN